IKDVLEEDSAHLLMATGFHLYRLDSDKFDLMENLIDKRLTSVALAQGKIYVGTLDGLMVNDSAGYFRKIFTTNPSINTHLLKVRAAPGNVIWIANNKGELIGIQGERIIAQIGQQSGLQCNRVSAIKASGDFIWVGTDKGLYAIQNKAPYRIVRHLGQAAGLHSSEITCLDLYGSRVWVGTTKGINYFNEQDVFTQSIKPQLIINRIDNGGKVLQPQENTTIQLSDKALAIDFDIVDQEGGQRPSYQYRTSNDSTWINLDNNTLYFAKVPYGHFDISIRANSPNWKSPALSTLHFYQPYPVYLRWWFLALVLLILTAAAFSGIALYLRSARKKDEEKVAVQRKLLQLEQMALQGQMNPHFIFNCIAAIKQYYSSGDHVRANEFVDRFSGLIRQTFEMGAQLFISLDKELNYLAQYLAIEQTRFDHSFDFSIRKELSLPESSIYVPVLLLQPLAENAVRHGIRHLTGRRGKVDITVVQDDKLVTISLTDNGVGRTKSKSFSQFLQNIVPLTSTTVNRKRIELLNQLLGEKIAYHTEDVLDEQGNITGTKVTIAYPLSVHHLQT
ncbi:MAG TPA: histidine kinase, partial [Chitinophagaceae bacterium]|nr:histidine kinase [Chitinophagaceae bacterium]